MADAFIICVTTGALLAFVSQVDGMATDLKSQVVESCELMGIPATGMLKGIMSSEKRGNYQTCREKITAAINEVDYKLVYAIVNRFKKDTNPDEVKTIVGIFHSAGWTSEQTVTIIECLHFGKLQRVELLRKVTRYQTNQWGRFRQLMRREPKTFGELANYAVLNQDHKSALELYLEWQTSVDGVCRNKIKILLPHITKKASVEKDKEIQKMMAGYCCYEEYEPSATKHCVGWTYEMLKFMFSDEKIGSASAANMGKILLDGFGVVSALRDFKDSGNLGWDLSTVYDVIIKWEQESISAMTGAMETAIRIKMRKSTFDELLARVGKSRGLAKARCLNFIAHLGRCSLSSNAKEASIGALLGPDSADADIVRLVWEAYTYALTESTTITNSEEPGVVDVLFKCASRCTIDQIIDLLRFASQKGLKSNCLSSSADYYYSGEATTHSVNLGLSKPPLPENCNLHEIKQRALQNLNR